MARIQYNNYRFKIYSIITFDGYETLIEILVNRLLNLKIPLHLALE
jgi:hypothetical protein